MPPPHPRPGDPPSPIPIPIPPPPHDKPPSPILRLKIQDLTDPGTHLFLHSVHAGHLLEDAVATVLRLLYPTPYQSTWPGTRSVTVIVRAMDGVAYTRGKDIDRDHKEIHLSSRYVKSIKAELLAREITGVIVHEMVHCWQWDGCGTGPGGLIEGVADWVRLKAGLAPPHWERKRTGDDWDKGYQVTAWFLDWLGEVYGEETVPRLNFLLRDVEYEEKTFWAERCGFHKTVQELWGEYEKWLAKRDQIEGVGKGVQKEEEQEDEEEEEERPSGERDGGRNVAIGEKGKEGHDDGSREDSERVEKEVDNDWTEIEGGVHLALREQSFEEEGG